MKKKSSDFLTKGLLLALILMVIDLIGGFAHLRFETWFKWIGTIVLVIVLIVFCIQFGKQKTDGVSFGNVFGYGFRISLVVAVLIMIYSLISVYLIFPEYVDQVIAQSRATLEAKGNMSEDQIDQGVAMTRKFMTPVPVAIFSFLGTLIVGIIGALLGAAFTKKSEATPAIFQDNPPS
jgi:uncharacterized membrane protein YciS (DUF1049 family)